MKILETALGKLVDILNKDKPVSWWVDPQPQDGFVGFGVRHGGIDIGSKWTKEELDELIEKFTELRNTLE